MGNLVGLLEYHDTHIVASALQTVLALAEAWRGDAALCAVLLHDGQLLPPLLRLLQSGAGDPPTAAGELTWARALRTAALLCGAAPAAALGPLLAMGMAAAAPALYASARRAEGPAPLQELLALAGEMFPPLLPSLLPLAVWRATGAFGGGAFGGLGLVGGGAFGGFGGPGRGGIVVDDAGGEFLFVVFA